MNLCHGFNAKPFSSWRYFAITLRQAQGDKQFDCVSFVSVFGVIVTLSLAKGYCDEF